MICSITPFFKTEKKNIFLQLKTAPRKKINA